MTTHSTAVSTIINHIHHLWHLYNLFRTRTMQAFRNQSWLVCTNLSHFLQMQHHNGKRKFVYVYRFMCKPFLSFSAELVLLICYVCLNEIYFLYFIHYLITIQSKKAAKFELMYKYHFFGPPCTQWCKKMGCWPMQSKRCQIFHNKVMRGAIFNDYKRSHYNCQICP